MAFSCSLAIGLSLLCGFVFIACVAQVYYLLLSKKKKQDIENQDSSSSSSSSSKCTPCFKTPTFSRKSKTHQQDLQNCEDKIENHENDEKEQEPIEKDSNFKGFGEESLDLELMRLHNLCGPPRFLFTINEETKEDLESEGKKGGSRMSLSDLLCIPETPNSSSSPLKTSQASNLEGYLNPLFDCCESNEFDIINKITSSPPPTFKFLRDAEEKLLKKLMQLEAEEKRTSNLKKNQDGSFVKLSNDKGKSEGKIIHYHHHHQMSTPSQVLPLASSPSNLRIA